MDESSAELPNDDTHEIQQTPPRHYHSQSDVAYHHANQINGKVQSADNNNGSIIKMTEVEMATSRSPGLDKRRRRHSARGRKRDSLHVQFNSQSGDSDSDSESSEESPSSSPSSSSVFTVPEAPDGGWGWVVVAASFFINLIADGITFSFGIIYDDFLNYFGESKSLTAWIAGTFMAMPLLSGPVASFLADRFGCRRVAIFGAILASIGFIVSAFVNSLFVLLITFGIFAGFGLSLCYVAAIVIVAYYFDKRRSTATGISVCGSGIGTMVFAPLTRYLLQEYGWRGTLLILAGFILNICVCGVLMRDLPGTQDRCKAKRLANRRKRTQSQRTTLSSADSLAGQSATNAAEMMIRPEPRFTNSLLCIPTYVRTGERVPPEVLELLSTHRSVYNRILQNYPSLLTSGRSLSDSEQLSEQATVTSIKSVPPLHLCVASDDPISTRQKSDLSAQPKRAPAAYLQDLRIHRRSLTYRGAMLNINRYHLRASSCPDIYRNSMTTIAKEKQECYSGIWEFYYLLAEILDFSYFLDVRFSLFALSNFLLYTWYDVPYVYLYNSALEMGYSDFDSSLLISVIGCANVVGELILGGLGDCSGVNPTLLYAVCMLFCGAATALMPLLSAPVALRILAAKFGFFIAANYSLTSIILVELISIDRFTNAYGLLLLVQGVANLIGPPLAGWIYDMTSSYDLTFYLAGSFIALSGIMLLILPSIDSIKNYRSVGKQQHSTTGYLAPSPSKSGGGRSTDLA